MEKFLVIQTAFIGDVVLATALAEKLHGYFPSARIDYLVRKGNESLLTGNPYISNVLIWDKKSNKTQNLARLVRIIRANKYDVVINVQRYFSTGLLTAFSGARERVGFDKNPLSRFFTKRIKHVFDTGSPRHEVEKNNDLIRDFTDDLVIRPALYPSPSDFRVIEDYIKQPFVTMTPSSVWFTKKYPVEKWIDLINRFDTGIKIFLLGGKENKEEADHIMNLASNKSVEVLAGKLSFLQSAALMKHAAMNYVNDSAPLHFASAVNAPVTAIYCSTVPAFGYTPLSDLSFIVETSEKLSCKPCGLHGWKACPLKHFRCAYGISTDQLIQIPLHYAV